MSAPHRFGQQEHRIPSGYDRSPATSNDGPFSNASSDTLNTSFTPGPSPVDPMEYSENEDVDMDVPVISNEADILGEAKNFILNDLGKDVEVLMRYLDSYVRQEYDIGRPDMLGDSTYPSSVGGPYSVPIKEELPCSDGSRRDAENIREATLEHTRKLLGSMDHMLGKLQTIKQSFTTAETMEKCLRVDKVPSMAAQRNAPKHQIDANVSLNPRAVAFLNHRRETEQLLNYGQKAIGKMLDMSMGSDPYEAAKHETMDSSSGFDDAVQYSDGDTRSVSTGADVSGTIKSEPLDDDFYGFF